jgi:hypothetical protein
MASRTIEITKGEDGTLTAQVTNVSDPTPYTLDEVVNAITSCNSRLEQFQRQQAAQAEHFAGQIDLVNDEKGFYSDLLTKLQAALR